jgi:hypothetical protein
LAVVFFAVVFCALVLDVAFAAVLIPVALTALVFTALVLAAVRVEAAERAALAPRLAAADFTPLATLFIRVFCDTACAWTATPLFDVGWQTPRDANGVVGTCSRMCLK